MAEEVRIAGYIAAAAGRGEEDDERVVEWEDGLPNGDDLTPLSQSLISSELLSAFNITPEPYRSMIDVNRASQNTLANLQPSLTKFNSLTSIKGDKMDVEGEETADLPPGGSDFRKLQRLGSGDGGDGDVDGGGAVDETEFDLQTDDPSARVSKRPRLVWTPQLHKRFIEVVAHLGLKNAVPKTIMQLMNVEGLTRENVASHLQKYRLYLKRMQGSPQGPSNSDHLSGSGSGSRTIPMPYAPQMVNHMPYPVPNSEFKSNLHQYNSVYHHGMTPNRK